MNDTARRMAADMLRWGADNGVGRLFKKADIERYAGLSRRKVDEITNRLQPAGSKTTFFYLDIAQELVRSADRRR